jgi:L-aspartate oxidase
MNWCRPGGPLRYRQGQRLRLGREGGHSRRRIIHAHDMTGAEIERILVEKAQAHPNIQIFEYHMGVDLVTREKLVRRGA